MHRISDFCGNDISIVIQSPQSSDIQTYHVMTYEYHDIPTSWQYILAFATAHCTPIHCIKPRNLFSSTLRLVQSHLQLSDLRWMLTPPLFQQRFHFLSNQISASLVSKSATTIYISSNLHNANDFSSVFSRKISKERNWTTIGGFSINQSKILRPG